MPRLDKFTGKDPIKLLSFLRELRQAMNGVGLSEGAAVTIISWFLEGTALQVYSHHVFSGIRSTTNATACWVTIVNTLLERYITDDIISDANNRIVTAKQDLDETESDFATRLEGYADSCSGVYTDETLTHLFIRGLLPTTQPVVAERIRRLTLTEQKNFSIVRRIALSEGTTYRARAAQMNATAPPKTPPSSRHPSTTRSASARNLLMWESDSEPTFPPSGALIDDRGDFVLVVPSQHGTATTSSGAPSTADETLDISKRIETVFPVRIPSLTEEQIRQAKAMIPIQQDGWTCWFCRETGHLMYSCPLLTYEQQLYCAYRNYAWQLETRPHMRPLYEALAAQGGMKRSIRSADHPRRLTRPDVRHDPRQEFSRSETRYPRHVNFDNRGTRSPTQAHRSVLRPSSRGPPQVAMVINESTACPAPKTILQRPRDDSDSGDSYESRTSDDSVTNEDRSKNE